LKQFTNSMMPSKKYIFGWLHNEFCLVHCSYLLYIATSLELHICNSFLLIQIQQERGTFQLLESCTQNKRTLCHLSALLNIQTGYGRGACSHLQVFGQEKEDGSILIMIFASFYMQESQYQNLYHK
jgi:hypothetical protein